MERSAGCPHRQQAGLADERTEFRELLVVERAAAGTAALRQRQNDLSNTPCGYSPMARGKKCPGFDNFVSEIVIDRGARLVNNAGSVERNKLI
jgi:hypothetical protein